MTREYQVTGQRNATRIDQLTGQPAPGMDVTFQDMQTGVVDTVFVPNNIYNAANTDNLIMARINQIRQVHSLGDTA